MARKIGATREQVIDEAVAIADRDGLPAVTLTRVATAVGVRPPSLYAHIDGLQDLRRALTLRAIDHLTETFRSAMNAHDDPREVLRAIADGYRRFAHSHPGLYASLLPVPRADIDPEGAAAAAEPIRIIAAALAELGVAGDRHIDVIRTLRAFLHGFVDLELGGGFGMDQPVDQSFRRAVGLIVGGLDIAAEPEAG